MAVSISINVQPKAKQIRKSDKILLTDEYQREREREGEKGDK